ncbi:shikimate kinase AroL [Enterobacteriaceae bacterium H20N1]|uniref:Shikimate kinase 2 n=1 Tax=Dryocola boscaweniae TaxID=2925397 RepID=A0A9X3APJ5_9ENTR|nr:shikimate kinase AroL [Dryocola boscaweniae]MCT4701090.1 shikimate kinase AroL [Dryocola boscaweniae]MCT4718134.1 shikimate kinase AroL [Dryocola boscaweniae]
MTQPIFLVGARGCGKTTVGVALAQALDRGFVDTDNYLLTRTNMSVADIVAQEGWDGFRARETQALKSVTAPDVVVATGGGMVLAEGNRQFMREQGVVIYLRAPAQILADRLEAFPEEGQRPTLTGKPITDEIVEVLAAREALYRQAAHHVIDASHAPDAVVDAVLAALHMARAS